MSNAARKIDRGKTGSIATVMEDPKTFYLCDPKKNVKCTGKGKVTCQTDMCFCTIHKEYSTDGKPLTNGEYHYHEQRLRNKLHVDTIAHDDTREASQK